MDTSCSSLTSPCVRARTDPLIPRHRSSFNTSMFPTSARSFNLSGAFDQAMPLSDAIRNPERFTLIYPSRITCCSVKRDVENNHFPISEFGPKDSAKSRYPIDPPYSILLI
ncbi:hypothetical protein THIOKS140008 [Thiocapsa sp. KS1]|nr:hypothetical protein THIOKS140008 [Thiocapsa sp. KS1]